MTEPELPLAGVQVVDFTDRLAGAYCTKLLVDAGADVTMVEPPEGDPLRRWSVTRSAGKDGNRDGALFRFLGCSKRSVVADLDTDEGIQQARDLAGGADLVVESWVPGEAERRGLDVGALSARNPAAVVVSISAFGRGGPRSHENPPEFILQALSGSSFDHGTPDGLPLAVPALLGEWGTGAFAAAGAVAGLAAARATGRGVPVDVSMFESLITTHSAYPVLLSRILGMPASRFKGVPVPGNETTVDGWVGFYMLSAQQWFDFAAMVGDERLLADESLSNMLNRLFRVQEIRDIIREWSNEQTTADILEMAQLFRVPAAPLATGATLRDLDYVRGRESLAPYPGGGFLQPVPAAHWGVERRLLAPAPRLGEHTGDESPVRLAPASADAGGDAGAGPLAGVRVLDLTTFWAGPFGGELLVTLGADVIKVESIQRADGARYASMAPPTDPTWYEQGPLFNSVNLGKRSVTLDLGSPRGRQLFLQLVATADVVIENFTPRVMETFELGYEVLREARPDIIFVRAPAFGLDGPWRDRPGFAVTMEQATGLAWITGYENGEPLVANGPYDPIAGTHAAFAVIAALEGRHRTGEGRLIVLPMLDMALATMSELLLEHEVYGNDLRRVGNRSQNAVPQGIYPCAEPSTWVALSVQTDEQWRTLAGVVGHDDWGADERLATVDARWEARDELDDAVAKWAGERTVANAVADLEAAGIPVAPVIPPDQSIDDPQIVARRFFQEVEHPVLGRMPFQGMPFRIGERPFYPGPSPFLGAHNDEILGELGLSAEQRAELREKNVIGERPVGIEAD